jgi:hypothetical protein
MTPTTNAGKRASFPARFLSAAASGIFSFSALAGEETPDRFGLSLHAAFNTKVNFTSLRGYPSPSQPSPGAGGGLDRTYDDGFVRKDASGNAGGQTWNWGYEHDSQIAGGAVQYHSVTALASGAATQRENPLWGAELTYEHSLRRSSALDWGLEAGWGFNLFDFRNDQTLAAPATMLTDSYALNGVVPPLAPYSGSFNGPGPVLTDTPMRTEGPLANGASVSGTRRMEGQLYTLRFGPYLGVPLGKDFALHLGAGPALAVINSEFQFSETVTLAGGAVGQSQGEAQDVDFLGGANVAGQVIWQISAKVGVFVGAQFQYLNSFTQQASGKEAKLDLGATIFGSAGVKWSF